MIRNLALALSVVGIFALLVVNDFSGVRELESIENARVNERVVLSGKVLSLTPLSREKYILELKTNSSNIEVLCRCKLDFSIAGKHVVIEGTVNKYRNRKQVIAKKIYLT